LVVIAQSSQAIRPPTFPGRFIPSQITAGPEGDLWFTERAELESTNIGRITPAGEVTQFPILAFSEPQGIALGPEGKLWFAEINNPECTSSPPGCRSKVGRIDPTTHAVAEFSTGITEGSQPWDIAAGPDGNLWFSERTGPVGYAGQMARINPTTHVVTEFSAGITGDTEPDGVTAGPDGNVWFTEEVGNRIGRITPSGTITEFPIPSTNSAPVAIVTGSDGNLWFAEQDTTTIGRITPTGTITEFPLPSPDGEPRAIAAGPDGNIWFAMDNGDIGRITPAGVVTTCTTGISGDIEGLTAGPDESMWFVEYYEGRIGKITATGTGLAPNCTGGAPSPTPTPTPAPAPIPPAPAPNSAFSSLSAAVNATTGAITFTETVTQPGTFTWLLTFQNGKFGVFAAKSTKCKKGFIKLNGKCRPSKITFGKGRETLAAAGSATFTVKPSASASKALKEALKHKKGLPVAVTITFQSVRGGAAVTHAQSLTVKLKRK
jgi:streptogramin lyase